MRVGIVGVGSIGSTMMAAFSIKGHEVLGNDVRKDPFSSISSTEKDLAHFVEKYHLRERIRDLETLVKESEIIFIIVPTPSLPSGRFSTEYVEEVVDGISKIDRDKTCVINSTVPPGTCRRLSEKVTDLYYNPLYIRLGSVIEDILKIAFVMIGSRDGKDVGKAREFWDTVSEGQAFTGTWETVEVTKLLLNSIMTSNISLINKIGEVYTKSNADIAYLSNILPLDRRFFLSSFRPGTGYGGPCLPRDNKMIQEYCREIGVNSGLFRAIDEVNEEQVGNMTKIAEPFERIGVYGVGYKVGSEITTDSQGYILAQTLKDMGKTVEIFDPVSKELSTVTTERELEEKSDIVILTLPYNTGLEKVVKMWKL